MKIGTTLGTVLTGLVIFAGPFSVTELSNTQSLKPGSVSGSLLYAAEVVRSLSLEERVERLEAQLQSRNSILADLQFKLSDLQEQVRNLLGTQEENNYRLTQLTERQREIYKDVDSRLTEARDQLQKFLADNGASTANRRPSNSFRSSANTNQGQTAVGANARTEVSASSAESNSYESIFPLVREKKYAKAISAYESFIAKYPHGKYTVNAHYWLGQVHFVQGQLDDAGRQFKLVIDKYPQSRKAPDAMLKLAIILQQQNKSADAKNLFNKIIRNYPGSSTARLAERRLKEL